MEDHNGRAIQEQKWNHGRWENMPKTGLFESTFWFDQAFSWSYDLLVKQGNFGDAGEEE